MGQAPASRITRQTYTHPCKNNDPNPSGGAKGMASDIEIRYKEIQYLKRKLTELYVKHNTAGKTYDDLMKDMDLDYFPSKC